MKLTETPTTVQHEDIDGWITLTDKLIGLEVCTHKILERDTWRGENGVSVDVVSLADEFCHVIPTEYVPAVIRKLVVFAANGNIALAAAALKDDAKEQAK